MEKNTRIKTRIGKVMSVSGNAIFFFTTEAKNPITETFFDYFPLVAIIRKIFSFYSLMYVLLE